MVPVRRIALLDLGFSDVSNWWVVFRDLPETHSRFWKLLKPGFQHVECWRCDRGIWLRVEPCMEYVQVDAHEHPPWRMINPELNPTFFQVRRVVPLGKIRSPFHFGPQTCVEIVKSLLGLKTPWWLRTPYQLYQFLRKS